MNDHLRPPESASIDGDLRTRMEGKVERLEDGVHLLESATDALNRPELTDDDLLTLRELINQLPKMKDALDVLLTHAAAAELTAKFGKHSRWLQDAVQAKLKLDEAPTLLVGLKKILQQEQHAPHAPREGETRLMDGAPTSKSTALVIALGGGVGVAAIASQPWFLLLTPLAYLLATRVLPQEPTWTLLPDRLHLTEAGLDNPVGFSAIDGLSVMKDFVVVRTRGESKLVGTKEPERLISWLELLRSQWLANLEAKPRASSICPAREKETNAQGLALVVRDGVFFLPNDRLQLALKAITPHALPKAPNAHRLLELLSHVSEGRWNALGAHLAQACDGAWLARGATVDDTSGEFLTLSGSQPSDASDANSTRGRGELASLQLSFTLDDAGLKQRAFVQTLLTA